MVKIFFLLFNILLLSTGCPNSFIQNDKPIDADLGRIDIQKTDEPSTKKKSVLGNIAKIGVPVIGITALGVVSYLNKERINYIWKNPSKAHSILANKGLLKWGPSIDKQVKKEQEIAQAIKQRKEDRQLFFEQSDLLLQNPLEINNQNFIVSKDHPNNQKLVKELAWAQREYFLRRNYIIEYRTIPLYIQNFLEAFAKISPKQTLLPIKRRKLELIWEEMANARTFNPHDPKYANLTKGPEDLVRLQQVMLNLAYLTTLFSMFPMDWTKDFLESKVAPGSTTSLQQLIGNNSHAALILYFISKLNVQPAPFLTQNSFISKEYKEAFFTKIKQEILGIITRNHQGLAGTAESNLGDERFITNFTKLSRSTKQDSNNYLAIAIDNYLPRLVRTYFTDKQVLQRAGIYDLAAKGDRHAQFLLWVLYELEQSNYQLPPPLPRR